VRGNWEKKGLLERKVPAVRARAFDSMPFSKNRPAGEKQRRVQGELRNQKNEGGVVGESEQATSPSTLSAYHSPARSAKVEKEAITKGKGPKRRETKRETWENSI